MCNELWEGLYYTIHNYGCTIHGVVLIQSPYTLSGIGHCMVWNVDITDWEVGTVFYVHACMHALGL